MRLKLTIVAAATAVIAAGAFAPRVLSRAPEKQARPSPPVTRAAAPPVVAGPGEKAIVGTLDKYDSASRQLVLNTGKASLTFSVTADAVIRQGSRKLKAEDLVSHRGDRVKLRYSEASGQRRADWIVLALPARARG